MGIDSKFACQPDFRELHIPTYRCCTNIHRVGNFFHRHAAKKPQLDDLGFSRIRGGEPSQCLVECNNVDRRRQAVRLGDGLLKRNTLQLPPSFNRAFFSRVIYQHPPHNLRGCCKKMPTVLPVNVLNVHQFEECFMNERGGLKRVTWRLTRHVEARELAKLSVDEWRKLV